MGPKGQDGDDVPTPQRKGVPVLVTDHPSVENREESGNDSDIFLDTAFAISDPDFANLAGEYFDPDVDFADLLYPQKNDDGVQYPSLESSTPACYSMPSNCPKIQVQQAICSPHVPIQAMPTYTLRLFIQRPNLKTGAQRIANLILHTLKSYPLMMLRDNALPPFIHPHLVSSGVENNDMEPLTDCINLVHMLSNRIHGTRKLFWKNVRMECERLRADVRWVCDPEQDI